MRKALQLACLPLLLALAAIPTTAQNNPVYLWRNFAGQPGTPGTNDGTGTNARFSQPYCMAVDAGGNFYVSDYGNNTIRKITSAGMVTTLAGLDGVAGTNDGIGTNALFDGPGGVAVDGDTNLYVADVLNHTIRKMVLTGTNWSVSTFVGLPRIPGTNDGTGSTARFDNPNGVAADAATNIYVADFNNNAIRKITPDGTVTTIAGNTSITNFMGVVPGTNDGTGTGARFGGPNDLAVDSATNIYVADYYNNTIRKVSPAGSNWMVATFAGLAKHAGSSNGTGTAARFFEPVAVAVDNATNIYVADSGNSTIRRVTHDGVVTTVGGVAGRIGSVDGTNTAADFYFPDGVVTDGSGNLFVADAANYRISKGTLLPPINIASSGTDVTVSWPSSFAGWTLQQNSDAGNPTGWTVSSYTTNDDGTNKSITVAPTPGTLFFRLQGN